MWPARMIAPDEDFDGAPLLRTESSPWTRHGASTARSCTSPPSASSRPRSTATGLGRGARPGWTSYEWRLRYRSYDVTELVAGTTGAGARTSATAGTGADWVPRQPRPLRRRAGRLSRSSRSSSRTATARWSAPTRPGRPARPRRRPTTSTTARPSTPGGATLDRPGVADRSVRVHEVAFDTDRLDAVRRPPVRRQEIAPAAAGLDVAGGETLVDFGQNLVGWLRFTRAGRGRQDDHRPARRGARGRRALHPAAAHRPGHRPVRPQRGSGRLRAHHDLPRLPVRRDHRLAGRSDRGRRRGRGRALRPAPHRHFAAPTTCSTGCTRTRLELARQLPSTCRPTARSATSGSAGPATSRSSRPPRRTSSTSVRFLRDWLADLAARAGARRRPGAVRACPTPEVLEPPPEGLAPIGQPAIWSDAAVWVPWALWQAYGDRRGPARASAPSMVAHVDRVEPRSPNDGLWDGGFQFGDWLDPSAPPDDPGEAKADTGVVATACLLPHRCAWSPRRPRSSAETTRRADFAGARRRGERRLHRALRRRRRPDPQRLPDRLRPRDRASTCSTAQTTQRAGDRLAELVARRTATGSRTGFAGHALRPRRTDLHRTPRRRLPAAAADASARPGSTR